MSTMSPWRKSKLTTSTSFQLTWLDYFGPFYVKDHKQEKKKVWICLFACIFLRVILLEIIADLTAEELFMTLKRFIARSGKPVKKVENSGTNSKRRRKDKNSKNIARD